MFEVVLTFCILLFKKILRDSFVFDQLILCDRISLKYSKTIRMLLNSFTETNFFMVSILRVWVRNLSLTWTAFELRLSTFCSAVWLSIKIKNTVYTSQYWVMNNVSQVKISFYFLIRTTNILFYLFNSSLLEFFSHCILWTLSWHRYSRAYYLFSSTLLKYTQQSDQSTQWIYKSIWLIEYLSTLGKVPYF
jgi:hypothetical protein